MPAPTVSELQAMLNAQKSGGSMETTPTTSSGVGPTWSQTDPNNLTNEPNNASDRPWPEAFTGEFVPDDGIKRLNRLGQTLPAISWLPLDNEIDESMKDKLIMALIEYCEKLGVGRFKTAPQAYSYFSIKSDKQLDRMNELAKKLKEEEDKRAEPQAVVSDASLGISPNTTPSRFIYKEGEIPKTVKMDHDGNVTTEEAVYPTKEQTGSDTGPEPVSGIDASQKPSDAGIPPIPPSGGTGPAE